MADPLLDARVLSVHRNSAWDRRGEFRKAVSELVQSPWAGWPVAGPRTFLWCCKLMREHVPHALAHHTRFMQLSGLLPIDPAAQEHELLCRAIVLLARRLQMLEIRHRDNVAVSLLGVQPEDGHIYLGIARTRGPLMIAPELEEFASGVLAKETAAAKTS